jgi:glycerol-3-phosphate dehydrogenase subunit C
MEPIDPANKIREVVDACSDCDICRYLMDTNCLFFPELYRLYDQEKETGQTISSEELKNLVQLCNYCALCACPNIRQDIMLAKTGLIDQEGLDAAIRILEDVESIGNVCGAFPQLSNMLFQNRRLATLLKKAGGIHADRRIPRFPEINFPRWVKKHRLPKKPLTSLTPRKVAYFAGCTGRHIFPDVAKTTVELLQAIGVHVSYPEQCCCGMPTMLEGDRKRTLEFARLTVESLADAVDNGCSIVCSCPTCGYMLKSVLREGAYYSPEYQEKVGADEKHLKIPSDQMDSVANCNGFVFLKKTIYKDILQDNGYFSSIDPLKRIKVAENTCDLGEYLGELNRLGELTLNLAPVSSTAVYFPPCHQREQKIGTPYLDLLKQIPELSITPIKGEFYCCGMGGIMGFKKDFHEASISMGQPLSSKIDEIKPDMIVTECLSCRLQFNQMTRYRVLHPVELISRNITD